MISYGLRNNGCIHRINMEHKIEGKSISDISRIIEIAVTVSFREQIKADKEMAYLAEGLPYISGYLFIPYGKEGINYVKEKIFPVTIEDFLQKRAEYLLDKTLYLNNPKYPTIPSKTFEYCRNFSQKNVTYDIVSILLLCSRIESEVIKNPIRISFHTSDSDVKKCQEFLSFKYDYFNDIKERITKIPDLDYHIEQIRNKHPFFEDFQLTDEKRKVIDNLPLFNMLLK